MIGAQRRWAVVDYGRFWAVSFRREGPLRAIVIRVVDDVDEMEIHGLTRLDKVCQLQGSMVVHHRGCSSTQLEEANPAATISRACLTGVFSPCETRPLVKTRAHIGWPNLLVLSVLTCSVESRAAADPEPRDRSAVHLIYTVAPGTEGCPDESAIRNSVSARLGYEPWDEKADRTLHASVKRGGRALVGRIELRSRQGKLLGKRELRSQGNDCKDLAASMELAISIAIDPLSITRTKPTAAPSPPPPPPSKADQPKIVYVPSPPPPAPTPPPLPGPPWKLAASLGGMVAFGSAPPSVAGGLTLGLRLRRGLFSVGAEGRFDLPANQDVQGGKISGFIMGGALLPCAHYKAFFGCVNVTAGALRAAGHDLLSAENVTMPYLATGLRLGAEIPLVSILALRVYGDLLATCTRISLKETDTGKVFWTTPPVSGVLGLGFVGNFL
jgi:hypothetical protein